MHDTKSYLARLVTRQALNALRAGARRREDYVGPWLPEPLLLDEQDPSADVVLAESVSMAMLVLLETLGPDERAVFVLREVFGFDYDEIASAVGKSAPAVRQIAHRSREHVQARRKRFAPADPEQNTPDRRGVHGGGSRRRCAGGDGDAGPRRGVDRRQRRQGQRGTPSGGRRRQGRPGDRRSDQPRHADARRPRRDGHLQRGAGRVALHRPTSLEGVFTIEIVDGKISNFYAMRNPDKLASVTTARKISRG